MTTLTQLESPTQSFQKLSLSLFGGRKNHITTPIGELVAKNNGFEHCVEVYQRRTTNEPIYSGLNGVCFKKSSTPATLPCPPQYESQLEQLEKVLAGYWKDRINHTQPWEEDIEEYKKYHAPIIAALAEYQPLLMKIILELASESSTVSTTDELLSSSSQTFDMALSFVCEINDELSISPETKDVVSHTIFSDPDNVPALIYYETKLNFRADGHPGDVVHYASDSMGYELTAQMSYRHYASKRLPTHQGLLFDGLIALVKLFDVAQEEDLFQEHKTSMGTAFYRFPYDRASFVHDMVKLHHRNHFEVFKWVLTCDLYDPSVEEFEPVLAERLGKAGPLIHRVVREKSHL